MCSLWDDTDQLKYGTYLTKKVFNTVRSIQLLWRLQAHFIPAALIILSMKRVRSKEYWYIPSTTGRKVKRISQPNLSYIRLIHTENIHSFNFTRLLPRIYMLFHNLFKILWVRTLNKSLSYTLVQPKRLIFNFMSFTLYNARSFKTTEIQDFI